MLLREGAGRVLIESKLELKKGFGWRRAFLKKDVDGFEKNLRSIIKKLFEALKCSR